VPRIGRIGAGITILFLLVALFGERLAPYPAGLADYAQILARPGAGHLMGTDHLGRDLLSRLIAGTRTTLGLALVVALVNSALALVLGALCGFLGGRLDAILMRLIDALLALPGFLLAVCFLGLFGGGAFQLVLYLVLTGWAQLARIVRNEVTVVRHLDFIAANTAAGYSASRNLFLHALPAVLPSVLVLLLNTLVGDVFAIVSLSFLGLGLSPQIPEWGTVLFDARSFFLSSPWLFAFPSALIAAFTLGLHLLADGLREYLDTRRFLFAVEEISLFAGSASTCGSDTP
jgi:ABC-type dipeptide/oligopeptide/nickel transport system permease subunit